MTAFAWLARWARGPWGARRAQSACPAAYWQVTLNHPRELGSLLLNRLLEPCLFLELPLFSVKCKGILLIEPRAQVPEHVCSMRNFAVLLAIARFIAVFPLAMPSIAEAQERSALLPSTTPVYHGRKPSVILIVADDLGYGDIGCYGQTKIKTPNIDRLASGGARFTSFYSGSTVCAPSRCALMTGQHTGHGYIRGNALVPLRLQDKTMAEVLKDAGYLTALIGKWGLGEPDSTGLPQRQGFDHFFGYLNQAHAHDYYTDNLWRRDPQSGFEGQSRFPENSGGNKKIYTHDLFTTAALSFVHQHSPDIFNKQQPFFLFLSYTVPHANNEETRVSGNGMQVPSDEPYSAQSWPQPEKNKAAMITRMDRDVGQLMAMLERHKVADSTIVIFTSDNGPHKEGGNDPKFFNSSGPFRGIKRDLYEGGIRVPFIVRWPDGVKPGRVVDEPWAMWDILPTLAEIAKTTPPSGIDGISMLPTLSGKTQTNRHDSFYWEFHEKGFHQAARKGDWKAVVPSGKKLELYDLSKDLGETNNVAAANPEIALQLTELMAASRTESELWPIKRASAAEKSLER